MKKIIALAAVLLALLTVVAASMISCDEKSQNSKLALKAMESGDYERARRLYNFAIERGEADSEDERMFDILSAYIDAQRCLKSEEFSEGLEIIDACKYDYNTLPIRDDMDNLYSQLSDGKYADERLKSLADVINAGDFERAKAMSEEIASLSLTSSQQERLYALIRSTAENDEENQGSIIYYVKLSESSDDKTAPMYYGPDSDSDELCRISAGEAVEVIGFAENGFIEVYYDGKTGYVKSSLLSSEPDDGDAASGGGKDEKSKDESEDEKNVVVEAISSGDRLFVITGVNFRTEPDVESKIIDVIPAGEEVIYLGETEHGFYKIEYDGEVGYVYCDYVQK